MTPPAARDHIYRPVAKDVQEAAEEMGAALE
jgi:hypothetical protein